ncbi:glycosyltransferase family 9 protein [Sporomusa sp.]|uniref:glycosyltransferase family 9 protein n=1 Tax=Sporomusa sp. TaxID=2078658 RepID=UPI002C9CC430|nr:glycosyltransferase family 9 protein [Sporomusa sp.]HWR45921.1 glycosyltransferase family 9 protein [Sporomusa sp.]
MAGALKAAWPDCKVTWLVGEVCADLIKYNPFVDEIIVWSRERFEKHLRSYEFKQAFALWRSLQAILGSRTFYAALDIHGLFLTGMIVREVKTDRRIGMSDARELNPLFMTETATPLGQHITERYLGVLKALGITPGYQKMTLVIPAEAEQFAANYVTSAGITPKEQIAILVPGTTWPTKNWPPELFARTAELLAKDFTIILCGGKAEVPLGREIEEKAGVPVINSIGKTTLLEMAGIIAKAAVVVAGDTGPLYMAAALETPTVAIFGPTNPETYAPPGKQNAIVVNKRDCSFCHKTKCQSGTNDCMSSITPEAVVQQVYNVVS